MYAHMEKCSSYKKDRNLLVGPDVWVLQIPYLNGAIAKSSRHLMNLNKTTDVLIWPSDKL